MFKVLLCFFVVMLATGCATHTKPYSSRLVESVNIGVLQDTRVNNWQRILKGQEVRANSVQVLNAQALHEQLEAGNIDLAIGLPHSGAAQQLRLWQTRPIMQRDFKFIARKDDPLKLKNYLFLGSFVNRAKSIGFVSEGESGAVNQMIVSQLPGATAFNGCGSLQSCMKALDSGSINALFVDNLQFKRKAQRLTTSDYLLCRLTHKQDFAVMVNQRTLSDSEFQQIDSLIKR